MTRVNKYKRPQASHCGRGHERTTSNWYINPTTLYGRCRLCRNSDLRSRRKMDPGYEHYPALLTMQKKRFGGNRERAIQRDKEKCVKCGMTRVAHFATYKRDITVDHIDGNGRYTTEGLQNNSLENLQTLCLRCHGRKDGRRRKKLNTGKENQ